MDYGEAVFGHRSNETGPDKKVVPGELDWVFADLKENDREPLSR
jgi:hypothetical protein